MKVSIHKSVPNGTVTAPPSKSVAHRMIICAALSNGESVIKNVGSSEDIRATLSCIKAIGADYRLNANELTVRGMKNRIPDITETIHCNESGSSLRFFMPLCMLSENGGILTGSKRLLSRPNHIYENICRERGLRYENDGSRIILGGGLQGGDFAFAGNVSSQFASGLLFALPLATQNSTIRLLDRVESKPYIDLTLYVQRYFGIKNVWANDNTLYIPGNKAYTPARLTVEGDWSSAAFFFALRECGAAVTVNGLNEQSLQADKCCSDLFSALSQSFCEIDISNCIDLGPLLFVFAALHHGARFINVNRLRYKETNRIYAIRQELQKCGCSIQTDENALYVPGGSLYAPADPFFGHNDHRTVMALTLLCVLYGGTVEGAQAVNKSYPSFFQDLQNIGVKTEITE